jgi:hypothetical protein
MAKRIEEGKDCAFTIDGPRGPRYVAKPGPVMLARRTGAPVMVFHIGVEHGKTFEKTWDHFLLPSLFTRTVMIFAPPIEVPSDADSASLEAKHAQMQKNSNVCAILPKPGLLCRSLNAAVTAPNSENRAVSLQFQITNSRERGLVSASNF